MGNLVGNLAGPCCGSEEMEQQMTTEQRSEITESEYLNAMSPDDEQIELSHGLLALPVIVEFPDLETSISAEKAQRRSPSSPLLKEKVAAHTHLSSHLLPPIVDSPSKIEVSADIMANYIMNMNEHHLLQIWNQIDIDGTDRISMEQFRELLVLMVDQYIDSQMNAVHKRDSHILTPSLTVLKVDHSRGSTVDDDGECEQSKIPKPSVIFDCNEMMELEEMMGDMVKHSRSAPVVDYLYDQFQAQWHLNESNLTKSFYLNNFQKCCQQPLDSVVE